MSIETDEHLARHQRIGAEAERARIREWAEARLEATVPDPNVYATEADRQFELIDQNACVGTLEALIEFLDKSE